MNTSELNKKPVISPLLILGIAFFCLSSVGYTLILINSLDNTLRVSLVSLFAIIFALGSTLFYFIFISNQATLAQLLQDLENQSNTDALTAVYSRQYFQKRYAEEYDRATRYGHNLALIMVDVDHFAEINRDHGTNAGDLALQTLAELLRTGCRTSDIIARYGSDSFAILIPEGDTAGTLVLAEKLRSSAATSSVTIESHGKPVFDLQFTVSLGMACMDNTIVNADRPRADLIAQADSALYRAKHVGRNRVMAT